MPAPTVPVAATPCQPPAIYEPPRLQLPPPPCQPAPPPCPAPLWSADEVRLTETTRWKALYPLRVRDSDGEKPDCSANHDTHMNPINRITTPRKPYQC